MRRRDVPMAILATASTSAFVACGGPQSVTRASPADTPIDNSPQTGTSTASSSGAAQSFTPYYAQTTVEAAASVAPVNYAYPPGVVERYGAKADSGVTDNTAAINSALACGGDVELPAAAGGYYGITGALTVAVAGTKLFSRARARIVQSTTESTGSYNDPVNANLGINISASNVVIEGIHITGPQYAALNYSETGICASGTDCNNPITYITVRQCSVQNWGFNGIRARYVNYLRIEHNDISNIFFQGIIGESVNVANVAGNRITNVTGNSEGNAYGMDFATATNNLQTDPPPVDINVHDNFVYNVPAWAGLHCHFGRRVHFVNNTVRYCRLGINVATNAPAAPTGSDSASDIVILGNTVTAEGIANQHRGIGVNGYTSADTAARIVIAENQVDGYGLDANCEGAIRVQMVSDISITDNVITDSTTAGIALNTYAYNCRIGGNVINGVTQGTAAVVGGIIAYYDVSGRIDNNYVSSGALPCINIVDGANSTGLDFGPNTLVSTNETGPWNFTTADIGGGAEMFGSTVWSPGLLANGNTVTTKVTVYSANLGDLVQVSPGASAAGLMPFGYVDGGGSVRIGLLNLTGGPVTLPSSTWTVKVTKHN